MPNYTQQQLEERYQKLPDVLKDAMFSVDVAAKMFEIGKKYGLTIDKIGFMAEETGYIILGLTRPSEFVKNLTEALAVEESKARTIASDINHQVLFLLREALKTTHQIEINEEAIQKNSIILKKNPPLQSATAPSPEIISAPKPIEPPPQPQPVKIPEQKLSEPSLPPSQSTPIPKPILTPESSLPPLVLKPLEEKPTIAIPTPTPKPPVEKTPPLLLPPQATLKTEPIDLRLQQKIKPPEPPPRPESMGGSIFGAPSIVNLAPKPSLPPQPPTEKPLAPKSAPSYDPYREPTE